jgi:CDP-diacylglycerol--serine O-phosphatidyltransferase
MDSLVDGCSFGVAPTVLLHAAGMRSIPEIGLLFLFACSAVWRLAYFDVVGMVGESEGKTTHFIGLPTTYVALVLPIAFLVGFVGVDELRVAAVACAVLLPCAMVSPLRIRKPTGLWYPFFALLAVAMLGIYIGLAERFPGV